MNSTTRMRALAVLAAVLIPVAIWLLAVPLLGADLKVPGREEGRLEEVGLGPVVTFSLGAGLAGWALLALLERFTPRARTIWTVLAAVVLLLSFLPLTAGEIAGSTRLTLGLMHITVGTALIPVLRGTGGSGYSKTGQPQSQLNAPR